MYFEIITRVFLLKQNDIYKYTLHILSARERKKKCYSLTVFICCFALLIHFERFVMLALFIGIDSLRISINVKFVQVSLIFLVCVFFCVCLPPDCLV